MPAVGPSDNYYPAPGNAPAATKNRTNGRMRVGTAFRKYETLVSSSCKACGSAAAAGASIDRPAGVQFVGPPTSDEFEPHRGQEHESKRSRYLLT
jgi:hypothetical protein